MYMVSVLYLVRMPTLCFHAHLCNPDHSDPPPSYARNVKP